MENMSANYAIAAIQVTLPSVSADSGNGAKKHVSSVLLGAGLAIGGNLLISIALNLQRYAHVRSSAEDKRHYLKSWVWWVGLVLMGAGELGNFVAYSFAPASVVAPLGMTTVLANAALAVIFLKEKLRPDDVLGASLAIVGAFLIVNFCSKEEPAVGLSGRMLIHFLKQPALLTYLAIEILAVAFLLYFRDKKYKDNDSVVIVLLISSLIGSWTVISAKAVAGLLRATISGDSQLSHPIFYIMAIILAATAVLQVKFLNQAMKENPATVVVPTNFAFFTLSAIIGGIVFYQEFQGLEMLGVVMFCIGCLLCFVGVYFITARDETYNIDKLLTPVYILAPSSPLFSVSDQTQRFVLLQPARQKQ